MILSILDLASSITQFYFILEVALVMMLTVQALFQPFEKRHHNWIATVIFCNLAVINALTIGIYLSILYGKEAQMLQWIQLILIYMPLFVAVPWAVYTMMSQVFRFDSYYSCCRAVFGGRRSIFQLKSQQEGCYSGCVRRILGNWS